LRPVAAYVLADLDEHGLLDRDIDDVARSAGCRPDDVDAAIDYLRRNAWAGIAAPDFGTYFQLELAALRHRGFAVPAIADQVFAGHLREWADGRDDEIAAVLGCPVDELVELRAVVRRHLAPPRLGRSSPTPQVVDATCDLHGERLVVEVVDEAWAGLRIAPSYRHLRDAEEVRTQLAAAQAFIARLQERASTLARVIEQLVIVQEAFVRDPAASRRPLTRAVVANELGLHESTVSRAVAGKVVRLPDGRVAPLSAFFGADGGVKDALRELLATGPARSDRLLAEQLAARGHRVARRTVAKYRAELQSDSAH